MKQTPRQIKDDYEIVSEIATGGMATVYKAVQRSLQRTVAIKELKKAYQGDGQIVQRFERESRVAASLQHENIAHIYDYWRKPAYCIVMEYVDGATLADVIARTGALPVDVATMIALQVCHALDYAHMRGLVHRDIKPGNIMIRRNGEVKLMDFGIAHTRSLESLTLPGTLIGTPSYMSPEQVLGQQLDSRSDIFSFGIVLYEIFTGVKPFADDDARSVSARIVKDAVLPPRRVNRNVPRSIQRVIRKCLRKKPKKRYRSMQEVGIKLGRRLAGRTTKSGSLRRIADYLVSRNVFEAAREQEAMIITASMRGTRLLRKLLVAAAAALLVAAGAAGERFYERTMKGATAALPLPPSADAPAAPKPPTAPAVVPVVPEAVPAPAVAPAAPSPAGQSAVDKPAPSEPSVSGEQKKEQPAPEKKKTAAKKKKKRTPAD